MLISAEPGIGKSRLTEALEERIAGEPHLRLRYFCSPHHQDSALYPIIGQLERAAGFARDDAPERGGASLPRCSAGAGRMAEICRCSPICCRCLPPQPAPRST